MIYRVCVAPNLRQTRTYCVIVHRDQARSASSVSFSGIRAQLVLLEGTG